MDAHSERIYDRMTLHRLMEKHPDWSIRQYADAVGKSVKWAWGWVKRIRSATDRHFRIYLDASRAPKNRKEETPPEVKKVIGELREDLSEKFNRNAGGKTILYFLRQRQDLKDMGYFVPTSARTISNILKELDYIPKRKKRHRTPLVLPAPNEEWEMDFGEIRFKDGTQLEFFLVVDRGTSRVIYLEGTEGYNAETSLEAVTRLLLTQGLPQRLRFDRDSRFVASWTSDSYPSALVRFLWVLGVEPVVCPPRRPDLKPFVESCVHTVKHEFLNKHAPATYADALELLDGFKFYHNADRPHQGQACNNMTPDEVFSELPALPYPAEQVTPDAWLKPYHGRVYRRRVSSDGMIQVDKYRYYVGRNFAGLRVLVHLDATNKSFHITHGDQILRVHDIKGLHQETIDLQTYLLMMQQEARSIERHRRMLWQREGDIA